MYNYDNDSFGQDKEEIMYIDPGTGSLIFQVLIAGAVGFAYVLKTQWLKIKSFLQGLLARLRRTNE